LLRIGDFVPASDTLLRNDLLVEAEKSLGLKVKLEGINGNDLQARITSGIQSGTGADIIVGLHNWPQLYAASLADVSDVAEEVGKTQGGYHDLFVTLAKSDKGWLAVPWCALGIAVTYRKSWFDEAGYAKFPETWEQYRDAGRKLKAKGRPIGQTLGHTYNDAPAFTYPYLWSWGGKEVEKDGKTGLGEVHGRLLERGARRERPRMGRFEQQSRVPGRHDQRDQQCRLDLYRGAAQTRSIQDREGCGPEGRYRACPVSSGAGGARRATPAAVAYGHGLFQEPESRQGFPALAAFEIRL
jgi:hypothetical protein